MEENCHLTDSGKSLPPEHDQAFWWCGSLGCPRQNSVVHNAHVSSIVTFKMFFKRFIYLKKKNPEQPEWEGREGKQEEERGEREADRQGSERSGHWLAGLLSKHPELQV